MATVEGSVKAYKAGDGQDIKELWRVVGSPLLQKCGASCNALDFSAEDVLTREQIEHGTSKQDRC